MKKRVFILDDEADVVDLLRIILIKEGFEVQHDTDAWRGLSRILEDIPDLLLLDLMMPGIDGFEVLKILRQDPEGCHLPILILSARIGNEDQIQSLQLGANAYVCKPFSPRELVIQVRQMLDASEPVS